MTDTRPIESQVRRDVGAAAEPAAFGSVHWASRQGDPEGAEMTVGVAVFDAGKSNPRHIHPNCEEVVFVLEGGYDAQNVSNGGEAVFSALAGAKEAPPAADPSPYPEPDIEARLEEVRREHGFK